jgi:hypothetical protein
VTDQEEAADLNDAAIKLFKTLAGIPAAIVMLQRADRLAVKRESG